MSFQEARFFSFRRPGAFRRCLFLFILVFCFLSCAAAENLLINGSFEETDPDGAPSGWVEDAYVRDEGYTVFSLTEDHSEDGGRQAASIRNIGPNDARYAQKAAVRPESLYRFSAMVKAENVEEGRGANLSVEGLYVFSESVYDTDGEWQYVEWYGETGEDQTSVTVFVRLGGYSGESTGQAWFDDVRLEEVDAVPGDETAALWYSQKSISVYGEDENDAGNGAASPAWPRLILLFLLYAGSAVAVLQQLRKRENRPGRVPDPDGGRTLFAAGLVLAFLLRLALSWFVTGYMVDVNCFLSWGDTMASVGPVDFYPATSFCDYPPAYTYILGLNALIRRAIPGIGDGATRLVFRFFPCLCDILACLVLDAFIARREKGISGKLRRGALLLLAFHPASILNSAAWGQMDSVLALLLLLVAVWAMEGRWQLSLPCYMLAVLVKPQALMLGFLGLAAVLRAWFREKESRRRILTGAGFSLAVLLAVVVPFTPKQDLFWIVRQYQETLGSYPYATVNTANFYYLFDGNWDGIANAADIRAALTLAVLSAGYAAFFYLRTRKKWKNAWVEASLSVLFSFWFLYCALAGASWAAAGTGAMAFSFLIVLSLFLRKKDISFLPWFGGLLFMLLYVFGVKMHERYVLPAFVLLALSCGVLRDRRLLTVFLGMTLTAFLNEGIVLDNSIRLGSSMGHLNADTSFLAQLTALINCAVTVYAVYLSVVLTEGDGGERASLRIREKEPAGDNRLHWNIRDTAALTAMLAVYSFVSLSTLGSAKAPQTAWTSTDYTESVVLDFGEYREDFCMLYFARVSRYDFSVAASADGETWEDETWAQMDQGQCWKWKYVTESSQNESGTRSYANGRHWFSGRYVRITSHQINLALCEVIFRDDDGNRIPVLSVARENGDETSPLYSDPALLTDEQDTFEALPVYFRSEASRADDESNPSVAQPCWWNSTYFDEIYHARTAWEFLTASSPYETSHPPLGKVLMSWSVALFGMTPFGWRFAGAAAGILMLAGVYLVVKQQTKSTGMSAFACGLLALDCMHLTQTQIATIDSFPVLFILFAYFFMLRFLQTDWRKEKRARVLADLGLSGLFMGLAVASKWIGAYAGAGLGVLFFWHGIRVLALDCRERGREEAGAERENASSSALKTFVTLCLWCVLFFVIVPAAVYCVSYIPYFAYRRFTSLSEYLNALIGAQFSMLNYHSTPGLGMDHPFYSPWYEWPVIGKPMYFATKQYVFNDDLSYSIFCFGNPVIWWSAIPAVICCWWLWYRYREEHLGDAERPASFATPDTELVFLLTGFLAQYAPWTLVPRGTYIYHYFASVPFLIFALTAVFGQLRRLRPAAGKWSMIIFTALAFAAMALLFPYTTGIYAPVSWLDAGRMLLRIWY